jgi:hypothetical protein
VAQADWQRFTRPRFALEFSYPPTTPRGQPVERNEQRRDDMERVHLSSPDREELYVEVARFTGITPQDEYANHKPFLEQRFGRDSVTGLAQTSLLDAPAWTYSIRWDEDGRPMERAVLLLQIGADTYRIIRDPRSGLNDEVMATIKIAE